MKAASQFVLSLAVLALPAAGQATPQLKQELRTKEALNATLAYTIVILVLFTIPFDPDSETPREISGGLLWVVFSFAGALALNRSFAREMQND